MKNKNDGFTLIELILVIVILGVLAAVAAPKFINLKNEAYAGIMKAVSASISSGKNMVYSACIVNTSCDQFAAAGGGNGSGNSIIVEGEVIILAYGYPRHTSTGIARMVNITDGEDFKITPYTNSGRAGLRIRPNADYGVNKCEIRYSEPLSAGEQPLVEVDLDHC